MKKEEYKMETTRGDISSTHSYDIFSIGEQEPESINFQESLKFFQDQLIINRSFPSPSNYLPHNELTNNIKTPSINDTAKFHSLRPTKRVEIIDDCPRSLDSCRIKIPTVDSILESVRVLRAIQKSQEQRGSIWSLDERASSNEFNFHKYAHIQDIIQSNLLQNGEMRSEPNILKLFHDQSDLSETILSNVNYGDLELITSNNAIKNESKHHNLTDNCIDNSSQLTVEKHLTNYHDNNIVENTNNSIKEPKQKNSFWPCNNSSLYNMDIASEFSMEKENSTYERTENIILNQDILFDSKILKNEQESEKGLICDSQMNTESLEETTDTLNTRQNIDHMNKEITQSNDIEREIVENLEINVDMTTNAEPVHQNVSMIDDFNSQSLSCEISSVLHPSESISQEYSSNDGDVSNSTDGNKTDNSLSEYPSPATTVDENMQIMTSTPLKDDASTLNVTFVIDDIVDDQSTSDLRDKYSNESTNNQRESNTELSKNIPGSKEIEIDNNDSKSQRNKNILSIDCQIESSVGLKQEIRTSKNNNIDDRNQSIDNTKICNDNIIDTSHETIKTNIVTCSEPTSEFDDSLKQVKWEITEHLKSNVDEQPFDDTSDNDEVENSSGTNYSNMISKVIVEIAKSLYKLPKLTQLAEMKENQMNLEESSFEARVNAILEISASIYPKKIYRVSVQERTLYILEENSVLFTMPLNYLEVDVKSDNTLSIDNRLGRSITVKADSEELRNVKGMLEEYSIYKQMEEDIIGVEYPLKYHQNVVIIDLGSFSTRAGILMNQPTLPQLFFPSICATNHKTKEHVYGIDALEIGHDSNISFPIRPSEKIKYNLNIDLVTGIFKKIFQDLNVEASQYTVQICLPRILNIHTQDALVKLLLEIFKVQSVSLTHQSIMTLYAYNVSTGVIVDIGERIDILPVVDGYIVESGVTRLPYGGERLIHHMKQALAKKHISLFNERDSFAVQYITKCLSYVAEDYENETKTVKAFPITIKKSITFPTFDKENDDLCTSITLSSLEEDRFKVPEGLFNPRLWGLDHPGIHKLVYKAIQATSIDLRRILAGNIYLSGGVTTISGFPERLMREMVKLFQPRIVPNIIASQYRDHCTYIGACRFASLKEFSNACLDINEYRKSQLNSLKKFSFF